MEAEVREIISHFQQKYAHFYMPQGRANAWREYARRMMPGAWKE